MESKSIAVVQQCYTEFGKGNITGVLDKLDENVSWTDPGYPDIPYAGKRKGKEEVAEFFNEMNGAIEFTQFEPKSFNADEGTVFVTGYFAGRSRKSGKTFETEWAMLWKIENEKVVHYQAYIDTNNVAKSLK